MFANVRSSKMIAETLIRRERIVRNFLIISLAGAFILISLDKLRKLTEGLSRLIGGWVFLMEFGFSHEFRWRRLPQISQIYADEILNTFAEGAKRILNFLPQMSQMGADGMGRTGVFRFSGTGAEGVHLLTHAPGRGGAGSSVTTGHGVPPRQPAGRRPTLHTCLLGNVAPEVITMSKVAKAFGPCPPVQVGNLRHSRLEVRATLQALDGIAQTAS
jgi:hypothetical protein